MIATEKRLDDTDKAILFYTDAIIKLYELKEIEILVLRSRPFLVARTMSKNVLIIASGFLTPW